MQRLPCNPRAAPGSVPLTPGAAALTPTSKHGAHRDAQHPALTQGLHPKGRSQHSHPDLAEHPPKSRAHPNGTCSPQHYATHHSSNAGEGTGGSQCNPTSSRPHHSPAATSRPHGEPSSISVPNPPPCSSCSPQNAPVASPEVGNSPPQRCPVYQELVPSTRENSRSISRPCFHSADTHYL